MERPESSLPATLPSGAITPLRATAESGPATKGEHIDICMRAHVRWNTGRSPATARPHVFFPSGAVAHGKPHVFGLSAREKVSAISRRLLTLLEATPALDFQRTFASALAPPVTIVPP